MTSTKHPIRRLALALACTGALASPSLAGLIVIEDQGDGSAWVTPNPVIDVAGGHEPNYFTTGVSVPAGGSGGQTFTPTETFVLDKVDVGYTAGASATVGVRLAEVTAALNGGGTAYEYTLGTELINLSFTHTVDTTGVRVLTLDFTGDDQVTLEAGKTYVLEFYDLGSSGVNFGLRRRGSSTYGGGMLFVNRSSVLGTTHRDTPMQFFAVPEPASLALFGVGVLCLAAGRRKTDTR